MKEKQRVMAGFEPNPAKKYPTPIIRGEAAKTKTKTPIVQMPHDICIANLRPKLSAIKGIMKNPNKDPTNTIDYRIVDVSVQRRNG